MPKQTDKTRRTLLRSLTAAAVSLAAERCLPLAQPSHPSRRIFDPRRYGAVGDGMALDTASIQHSIDLASRGGGGTVSLSAGRYVTGTLLLKTNVTLSLAQDATLLGSLDPADYRMVEPFTDGVGTARGYALLGCVDARNVAVIGRGTIDGRGAQLLAAVGSASSKLPSARPFLLLCVRSTQVAFTDVKLINSAAWTAHIFQCSDVTVERVSIRSVGLANNDGIDVDSSSRVHIDSCTIETGDDAICLKTTSSQPCSEITIKGCTMNTRCAAFKIGTESRGDFSTIRVSDCHVVEANLGAIKILSVDGAHISDVLIERMTVDDADTPIFLRLGARGRTFRPGDSPREPGTISGVVIRDIHVAQARRIGILISGLPGHTIGQITLSRISMTISGDAATQIPPEPPEAAAAYPEVRMFGPDLPAFGIYGRHLRNLRMIDVELSGAPGDVRPKQLFTDDHDDTAAALLRREMKPEHCRGVSS